MKLLMLAVAAFSGIIVNAQETPGKFDASHLPKLRGHHLEEYNFDVSVHPEKWNQGQSGLHAAFGSADQLYFRKEVPEIALAGQQQLVGWKGERVNM